MAEKRIPTVPEGDLKAVSLQIELDPIARDDLPVSVVQVLPLNEVQVRDQRENFRVAELSALSILSHFGESSVDLAIDYDHGMYYGENMEAAGWGEKVWAIVPDEWHDRIAPFIEEYGDRVGLMTSDDESEQGIFVFVRWTPAAAEKIRNREYRYISPVVFFDYLGNANYLWNAAIVNQPAIDGMNAIAASIMKPRRIEDDTNDPTAALSPVENTPDTGDNFSAAAEEGETEMQYEKIALALGIEIPEDGFDDETFETTVVERVEAISEAGANVEELASQLERVNSEAGETREALAKATEKVEAFEAAASELEAERERNVIAAAVADGRLAESQTEWATENFKAFEDLLPTLEETPQGPPQGPDVDPGTEKEISLKVDGSDEERVETIRAYAKENGITFSEAFQKLNP